MIIHDLELITQSFKIKYYHHNITHFIRVVILKFDNYLINIHSHIMSSLLIQTFMFMYIYYDKSLMKYTCMRARGSHKVNDEEMLCEVVEY